MLQSAVGSGDIDQFAYWFVRVVPILIGFLATSFFAYTWSEITKSQKPEDAKQKLQNLARAKIEMAMNVGVKTKDQYDYVVELLPHSGWSEEQQWHLKVYLESSLLRRKYGDYIKEPRKRDKTNTAERCRYCGCLVDEKKILCAQCGAPR